MNSLERQYSEVLGVYLSSGDITRWDYEPLKFRLAANTFFTPDFITIGNDGSITAIEVKGFLRDDAAVKFKVAAAMYPWIYWVMVKKRPKKHGGGWDTIYEL